MSTENQAMGGYGYVDDDVSPSGNSIKFGLNQGTFNLTKFEWINNAGKEGEEAEALEIQFTIEGREKPFSYRRYPVTKAYDKKNNNAEITDPQHPVFKEAVAELSQVITHILGCFMDKDKLREVLSKPVSSFKEYCKNCEAALPEGYQNKPLDAFAQYQWSIKQGNTATFLELPKNMSQGKFLCPATKETWVEVRTPKSLKYFNSEDMNLPEKERRKHPFERGEWFVGSNFAKHQKVEDNNNSGNNSAMNEGNTSASGW